MALSVIPYEASMTAILDANSFTLGELASHPLATSYVPKFDAFQDQWFTPTRPAPCWRSPPARPRAPSPARTTRSTTSWTRSTAPCSSSPRTTARPRSTHSYFGLKAAYLLKRPILSDELVTCRAWIPSLQTSTVASLAALATTLVTVVAAADAAVAQKIAADQALKDFDTIGGKKTLIDAFNALRKTVYGELAALPHQNPAAMLPANFADRFFPHDSHTGITSLTNPKDVQAKIDSWKKDVAAAEAHLAASTRRRWPRPRRRRRSRTRPPRSRGEEGRGGRQAEDQGRREGGQGRQEEAARPPGAACAPGAACGRALIRGAEDGRDHEDGRVRGYGSRRTAGGFTGEGVTVTVDGRMRGHGSRTAVTARASLVNRDPPAVHHRP